MFKELFTESTQSTQDKNGVYFDDNTSRWGIESDIAMFGKKISGKLFGVFMTKQNVKDQKLAERWCFKVSPSLVKEFPKPGSGFIVCKYITKTTLAGKLAPLCAINPDQGKVKFLKDVNSEPSEAAWDKPLKVSYMRISALDI